MKRQRTCWNRGYMPVHGEYCGNVSKRGETWSIFKVQKYCFLKMVKQEEQTIFHNNANWGGRYKWKHVNCYHRREVSCYMMEGGKSLWPRRDPLEVAEILETFLCTGLGGSYLGMCSLAIHYFGMATESSPCLLSWTEVPFLLRFCSCGVNCMGMLMKMYIDILGIFLGAYYISQ